jgi:hypothetical protein
MAKTARDLVLNCNGKQLTARKENLLNKTIFFLSKPALLDEPEFVVQSIVDLSVFSDFVKFIQGGQTDIRADNFRGLSALCSEFGCNQFSSLLSGFHSCRSGGGGAVDFRLLWMP